MTIKFYGELVKIAKNLGYMNKFVVTVYQECNVVLYKLKVLKSRS